MSNMIYMYFTLMYSLLCRSNLLQLIACKTAVISHLQFCLEWLGEFIYVLVVYIVCSFIVHGDETQTNK